MKILAIETSCDDTCIAILKIRGRKLEILSNIVSSQVKLHRKYGGVYPFLAKREHQKNLPIVFKKALKESGYPKIDLIAVTVGPGLEPCLWVGINFARELAKKLKRPLIPVNHIEAHILANFIDTKYKIRNTKHLFPAVCLVVSGGHTQLILMKGIGKGEEDKSSSSPCADAWEYKVIGETRDDAAGECFDKTARILGLRYPGGPIVAKMATKFKIQKSKVKINLPRPMMYTKDYDFSFSGLKTAVLYDFKNRSPKTKKSQQYIQEMSHEIQQAVIDVLIKKTIKATMDYKAKSIILGGGVTANEELRKQLKAKSYTLNINFLAPPKKLCTDNALMTAITAYYHQKEKTKEWKKIRADANLKI